MGVEPGEVPPGAAAALSPGQSSGYPELCHPSRVGIKLAGTSTGGGGGLGHRLITSMTTPRTYEITFTREGVLGIVNAFKDFDVSVGDRSYRRSAPRPP